MVMYLQHPGHAAMPAHYSEGSYGGWYLLFDPQWQKIELPKWDPGVNTLDVVLVDTEDNGKEYVARMPSAYEHFMFTSHPGVEVLTLQDYFFGSHYCACHRKTDALNKGAVTDEECEGNRFVIKRITCAKHPGLVLMSETYTEQELETLLHDPNRS